MAGEIRQPIDLDAFSQYVERNVPQIKTPIEVKQFGYGQSNPTYQVKASDGQKFVLRKKPPGKLVSKKAHQVEREYRIIHALENTDVPVPKTFGLCEDASVLGTPFYIMEFLDGRIFEDPSIPDVSGEDRREMWHDAIRTLAKLHRVDFKAVGLSDFGRIGGFYDRQIKTLSTISHSQGEVVDVETKKPVGKFPHFDEITTFYGNKSHQPEDRVTLVHGDYKLDNLVFHKTEPRVIGILDWEMSTIGHPLSDLSNLSTPFAYASQIVAFPAVSLVTHAGFLPDTRAPGLPIRNEIIEWYSQVAGWNPASKTAWGDAFGVFRNVVIMQGIAARYALRQASSANAKRYAENVEPMAEFAFMMLRVAEEEARANGQQLAKL